MKVAIIGCGMIANFAHIPAYRHLPNDFELVAVCDNNIEVARDTAQRHNIPYYTDNADKLLCDTCPDIVSVCVPNMFHKKYVEAALNCGAHVICEKPLAVSYSDAKELFVLAKSKNLMLCACQSMRFTPDRLDAKRFIDAGGLGDIYYGE
ncbi:MAG: Gfo/Idh/MocA family oxidoreductase, partial [Clostridia bacterium]|nr:Gfo/Idh/MocA family oxidoreductase [Clostridia bacterium]